MILSKLKSSLKFPGSRSQYSEISFPNRKNKKKARYRLVEGRTGQSDGISFEVVGKQDTYLRVKGKQLLPDKETADSYFNKDTTFVPLPDMWFNSFFAFESVSKPSYFIRLVNDNIILDKFNGTRDFKEEASFQLKRKPCATCLQVGVNTWAKLETGEYCLGKVQSIDNENIFIEFNDGKNKCYSTSEVLTSLVPDLVPIASELRIGTRVIAQWLHRHTLYAGIISGTRRGNNYDVLFDDGDTGREKLFQIRVMRHYSFAGEMCHDNVCQPDKQKDSNSLEKDSYKEGLWSTKSTLNSAESNSTISSTHFSCSPLPAKPQLPPCNYHPIISETFSQDSGYDEYAKGNGQTRIRKNAVSTKVLLGALNNIEYNCIEESPL